MLHKPQKGSALITALFIMTLVAIVATAMSMELQRNIEQTNITKTHDELVLASQVVLFWAMDALSERIPPITYPKSLALITPNIQTTGQLIDLQSKLNINNLKDNRYFMIFDALLADQCPEVESLQRAKAIQSIAQWIRMPPANEPHDPTAAYYLHQKPPYLPSHLDLVDESELALIANMTPKIIDKITPWISVLPEVTPININTAAPNILKMIAHGDITAILHAREKKPILDLNRIAPLLKQANIDPQNITVESNYFLCIATVVKHHKTLTVSTVIQRYQDKKKQFKIRVLKQKLF